MQIQEITTTTTDDPSRKRKHYIINLMLNEDELVTIGVCLTLGRNMLNNEAHVERATMMRGIILKHIGDEKKIEA